MNIFDKKELEAARFIINTGLQGAAKSLSFFMKDTVEVEKAEVNESLAEGDFYQKYLREPIYVLSTKIVGELEGTCCLIFTQQEAKQFQEAALPKEVTDNPTMFDSMKDAILLEADNIIAASVITQFANLLGKNIHGAVPELKKITPHEFKALLDTYVDDDAYIIDFKTTFISPKEAFSPVFVWFLNQPFIDGIKTYAAQKETLAK